MNGRYGATVFGVVVRVVVIGAILLLLIAVLSPSLNHSGPSKKSFCAANLKAIGLATAAYAAAWNDHLPQGSGRDCLWLCDLPVETGDTLATTMVSINGGLSTARARRLFYCPANITQKSDTLWSYHGVRMMGYAWLGSRDALGRLPDLAAIPLRLPPAPPLTYHDRWNATPDASITELAADWIISPNATGSRFTDISRPGAGDTFSSSHRNDKVPEGSNAQCFDGHVEWRRWSGPSQATPVACNGAVFWFVKPRP